MRHHDTSPHHPGLRFAGLLTALALFLAPAASAQIDIPCDGSEKPYVFILFDSSGSLNWAPPCDASQIANGDCDFLCPTGNCFVPLNGDDPASKLYQMKEALHTALAGHPDNLYGFTTLNQDDFRVQHKHWLYTVADTDPYGYPNPSIPLYTGRPYPEAGAEEVFGHTWNCDEGSGIREAGCWANSHRIADLDDAWETRRAQRLPKLGRDMNQTTTVYLRDSDGVRYRMRYRPVSSLPDGTPNVYGNPVFAVDIEVGRCLNNYSHCSTTTIGREIVFFDLVSDFSSWDGGADNSSPYDGFFNQSQAGDAVATYTCNGWEGNDDTANDLYYGYTLHFPTQNPPPLRFDTDFDGVPDLEDFGYGDMIPLDWENDHRTDIMQRLAPNTAIDPLATPDFSVASYLNDDRLPGEPFLRLQDENARPIAADGVSPWAHAIDDFMGFLWGHGNNPGPGFWDVASFLDPDFECRPKKLLVLADGGESCVSSSQTCAETQDLLNAFGIRTHVIGYGTSGSGDTLDCMANTGGTGQAERPQTPQELLDTLDSILD